MNNEITSSPVLQGIQYEDHILLEKLYTKYSEDKDLYKLIELMLMEKMYTDVKIDGLLYLRRALQITSERR